MTHILDLIDDPKVISDAVFFGGLVAAFAAAIVCELYLDLLRRERDRDAD